MADIKEYDQKETAITLTNEMWNTLGCYLLMTTHYRTEEQKAWEKLSQEMENDGVTPVYKNAANNADFWKSQNVKVEQILEVIRKAV